MSKNEKKKLIKKTHIIISFRMAKINGSKAAKALRVKTEQVTYKRKGITVPSDSLAILETTCHLQN